jgi:transposase
MLQITPQMRILVAVEAVDFRKGIDSLAELCRQKLDADPFSGCLFVFRSRRATSIKVLVYDGQGFWLATKRLSKGRFRWWPQDGEEGAEEPARALRVHQAQVLLAAGNPDIDAAPVWRKVKLIIFYLRSETLSGTLRMRWLHIAIGAGTSPAKRSSSSGSSSRSSGAEPLEAVAAAV